MIPRAVRVGVLGTRTAVNALSANGSRRVATPQSFPHVRRVCATAGACARDSKDLPEDGACVMDATPASGPRHRKLGTGPELREFVAAAGASGGLPCSAATFVPVRAHSSVAHAKVADGADDGSQVKSKMPRAAKGRESARSAANKVVRTPVEDLPPSSHIDTVHTYSWTQENEYDPLGTQDAYKKFCDPAFYAWSRLPPTEAYTIPPVAYYHEKYFGIEKNRLFARAWVAVGVSDQVREWGDTFITNVAGQPLFVTRSKDGEVGCRVCRGGGLRRGRPAAHVQRVRPHHLACRSVCCAHGVFRCGRSSTCAATAVPSSCARTASTASSRAPTTVGRTRATGGCWRPRTSRATGS